MTTRCGAWPVATLYGDVIVAICTLLQACTYGNTNTAADSDANGNIGSKVVGDYAENYPSSRAQNAAADKANC
ncbi:MAG: hypothetical protein CMO07_14220 [Thalassospira sp.]|uniref:hypothetical protein n=1 Tax=Thalassospira TaxID=168934 RepID=UPI00028731AE|nr:MULTISPECIES: hypothetical protein [Thalassospira]EKF06707.1 hypothetical protein TH2_17794 [Thalassospira profundimaris WP0211]MBE71836.1 hypothetical protein [Thalassospira sp.]|tara:strand:- start:101 stop:319 length:219 start_codon:yes stop_codon:yes gene_type:complete